MSDQPKAITMEKLPTGVLEAIFWAAARDLEETTDTTMRVGLTRTMAVVGAILDLRWAAGEVSDDNPTLRAHRLILDAALESVTPQGGIH